MNPGDAAAITLVAIAPGALMVAFQTVMLNTGLVL
jgi:hypothetical protein